MTPPAVAPPRSPRAIRRTRVYIGAVSAAAVALSWWVLRLSPLPDRPLDFFVFLLVTVLAARAPSGIRFPVAISINGVLQIVTITVIGATGALLLSPVGAILAHARSPLRAMIFNTAMRTCLTAACGLVYMVVADAIGAAAHPLMAPGAGVFAAALTLGLVNATLLAGVVTLWEQTSFRGQITMLLSETGLGLVAQAIVAYLIFVLWVPVGLGIASLIFGMQSLWASRWVLQQYGHRVKARENTLAALQAAIEVRSPEAARHTAAVAQMCENLAEELALNADDVDSARTAGTLHDLDVLVADLPNGERSQMRPLAPTGAISRVTFLAPALRAVGAPPGSPRAPSQDRTAAILAVADTFVLARQEQGDGGPAASEAAYASIRGRAGIEFDPTVVAALGRWLRRSRP